MTESKTNERTYPYLELLFRHRKGSVVWKKKYQVRQAIQNWWKATYVTYRLWRPCCRVLAHLSLNIFQSIQTLKSLWTVYLVILTFILKIKKDTRVLCFCDKNMCVNFHWAIFVTYFLVSQPIIFFLNTLLIHYIDACYALPLIYFSNYGPGKRAQVWLILLQCYVIFLFVVF